MRATLEPGTLAQGPAMPAWSVVADLRAVVPRVPP